MKTEKSFTEAIDYAVRRGCGSGMAHSIYATADGLYHVGEISDLPPPASVFVLRVAPAL